LLVLLVFCWAGSGFQWRGNETGSFQVRRCVVPISVEIPGFANGGLRIETIFTDFTGTLSFGGTLTAGVSDLLAELAGAVRVLVVTSDTFGTVRRELEDLPVEIHILDQGQPGHDRQKFQLLRKECPDLAHVAVLGNGRNDALVLDAVKAAGGVSIAVDNGEGVAHEAWANSNLSVYGAANALNVLYSSNRLKATLRR
jgi:soluble P-type ATPase